MTTTIADHRTPTERNAADRFARDAATHKLTVLRDDGLYRHLRCARPTSSMYWFEVVTWPGALAIRGDMDGGYVFARTDDMFEFFRSSGAYGINPQYWAEKLSHDVRAAVKEHSETVLMGYLLPEVTEYAKRYPALADRYATDKSAFDRLDRRQQWPYDVKGMHEPVKPMTPGGVHKLIAEYRADDRLRFESGARDLLQELEAADVLADTFEWRLTDWTPAFLWNCHAIAWVISQYDALNAGGGAR